MKTLTHGHLAHALDPILRTADVITKAELRDRITHLPPVKRVSFFVDLPEGWQDYSPLWMPAVLSFAPDGHPTHGKRRYQIDVDLPCFGGSADVAAILAGRVAEVKRE